MMKFQAPEGTTAVSVGGAQYDTGTDGCIEAPDNLAQLLLPAGFRLASPAAATDTATPVRTTRTRTTTSPAPEEAITPPAEATGGSSEAG